MILIFSLTCLIISITALNYNRQRLKRLQEYYDYLERRLDDAVRGLEEENTVELP